MFLHRNTCAAEQSTDTVQAESSLKRHLPDNHLVQGQEGTVPYSHTNSSDPPSL